MGQRRRLLQFSMAAALIIVAVFVFAIRDPQRVGAQAPGGPKGGPATAALGAPATEADTQAIRATADAFVKAFNAGDAKAIGTQWSPDAEYTDETGEEFHGAAEIEKEYDDLFKQNPGAKVSIMIESIRFLGPDIAMEKGIAKVTLPKGETSAARYSVVHARRDGKWIMVVGHDIPYVSALGDDYLRDLEWLIGDWTAATKDHTLRIRFEWMAQHNFIKNTYLLVKDGKSTLTGGQIIGWDPKLGKIVSWQFGAEGGFGHDIWSKDGSKWVIRAQGTLRDGSDSAAVNLVTPLDANSFTWQSTKRTLDGVNLPDVPPVKIVRVQSTAESNRK